MTSYETMLARADAGMEQNWAKARDWIGGLEFEQYCRFLRALGKDATPTEFCWNVLYAEETVVEALFNFARLGFAESSKRLALLRLEEPTDE